MLQIEHHFIYRCDLCRERVDNYENSVSCKRDQFCAGGALAYLPLLAFQMTSDERAFYIAEYSALRTDISVLVQQINANMALAFGVPGAAASWLLSDSGGDFRSYGTFLPFILCFLFGNLVFFANARRQEKIGYLRNLEGQLALPSFGGFETNAFGKKGGWFARMHSYTLCILYLFWFAFGFVALRF